MGATQTTPDDTGVDSRSFDVGAQSDSGSSDTSSNLGQALSSDGGGFETLAQPSDTSSPSTGGQLQNAISPSQGGVTGDLSAAQAAAGQQTPMSGSVGSRLKGVLYALASGGGIPGAIGGAIDPNLARTHFQQNEDVRAAKVQQTQAQAQFESVQAADMAIKASREATTVDLMNEEARGRIRQMNDAHAGYMLDTFGIQPDLTLEGNGQEVHDQATASLHTLAAENGGQIPPVSTITQPHTADNSKFKVSVYAPSQTDLQKNQAGFRKLVDTANAVQGLPPIDDLTWNSGGGKGYQGQRAMAAQAMQFLSPVQSFTEQDVGWKLAQRKQLVAAYQNHTDRNGQPDADPATVAALSKSVQFLQNAQDDITASKAKQQSDLTDAETAAKARQAVAIEKATAPIKLAQSKAEEAIKDGDPNAAGQLLVNGDVAPSQLVSSRKPAFAQAAFTAAQKINPQWNAQAAEGYYKAASSQGNVAFFGSAKSLTDQGGTLDQLQEAYNKLPNGQIPAFNKVSDWTAAASGSGATAGFAQTAIGVADDYAKVMGGGQGSDTAREEVLRSFAMSHSPQAMGSAINAARRAVDSQMSSRIGTNPVMRRMYGDQMLIHVQDKNGVDYPFRTQQQADGFKKEMGLQ